MARFAIKVVWNDGTEEYLKEGLSQTQIAVFPSRGRASSTVDFLREGMDGEVQAIYIVEAPRAAALAPHPEKAE